MAAQLQESYSGLELKVEERTHELALALTALDVKSRELEAASQHKSDFLANMSHELRTPLNAIIGFSQVLREEIVGEVNEKQTEYLDDILSSANHLLSLINDVLDLSKVEAGQIELEIAPFSLPRLARARRRHGARARDEGRRARSRSPRIPDVDVVEGDERRVRQVIFNLLSNAVKFTPAGGAVDVSAARVDGEVRVSVTRHRSRARTGGPRAHLRRVPADRSGSRAARGHRPRSCPLEAARRAARRPHLGRQRARAAAARSCSRCPWRCRAMAGERVLIVEDNEKNMKLFRDVLRGEGLRHAGGDERRAGGRARARARAGPRPDGHPTPGHRRHRGARAAARRRAHRRPSRCSPSPPRRCAAIASGSWPRGSTATSPSRWTSPSSPRPWASTATDGPMSDERDDPRRRRRPAERPPARGRARASRLRRRHGRRRARQRSRSSNRRARTSSCSTSCMPRDGRLRGLPTDPRARGDGRAPGDHGHVEHRAGEEAGDRGGRRRLRRRSPSTSTSCSTRVRSLLRIKRYHDTIKAQAVELLELNRTLEERVRTQVDELERLRRLRRFLSPQLADAIVSSGDESILASHRREVAMFFADLRGWTASPTARSRRS